MIGDIEKVNDVTMNYLIIADTDHKVSDLYDMIHPNASETTTVRSVFVIGPDNKVKLTITYPASTGRNFDEILRVIDSLQLTAKFQVATPADWKQGNDVIITAPCPTRTPRRSFPPDGMRRRPTCVSLHSRSSRHRRSSPHP